ncbi:MAG: hypothetical protein ABJJ44_03140 [Paraglaciecola sp.]|uniref:hypothetical protein n=1 Tax=Paraglaciecola sp. TaxID=1920173 RepID=UPI00329732FE
MKPIKTKAALSTILWLLMTQAYSKESNGNETIDKESIEIDLATAATENKLLKRHAPNNKTLLLRNLIPNITYATSETLTRPEIAVLTKPSGTLFSSGESSTPEDTTTTTNKKKVTDSNEINALIKEYCKVISDASSKILSAENESQVSEAVYLTEIALAEYNNKGLLNNFKNLVQTYQKATGSAKEQAFETIRVNLVTHRVEDACSTEKATADRLIKSTKKTILVTIEDDFTTDLTISRAKNGTVKSWNYSWIEEPQTIWLYNLSYVYIIDSGSKNYFSEPLATDNTQFVVRKYSSTTTNYVPAAMYTYVMNVEDYRTTGNSWGLSFGISMDPNRPGVLGGGSYILGKNITLTAGLSLNKQDKLRGRYTAYGINETVGSTSNTIQEQLEQDQLVESNFGLSIFFAIGFTFE